MLLPVAITDDRDRCVTAGRFLFRQKSAASASGNTEDGEIVRADNGGESAASIAFPPKPTNARLKPKTGEDRVLLADVAISRIGKSTEFFWILFVLGKQLHHLVRVRISRRGKEKPVYQAEHGGVHANAKSEHEHRGDGKPRRLDQLLETGYRKSRIISR